MHLQRVTKRFLAGTIRASEVEDAEPIWARVKPRPEPEAQVIEFPSNVILFRRA